jgi:DNA-binding response OmpR family regulator
MAADSSGQASVLVVDDEPTIVEIVSRYLQRAGYDAQVASDGYEAMGPGKHHVEDDEVGTPAGRQHYVVKPFSPAELVARVDAVLRRRPRGRSRFASATSRSTRRHGGRSSPAPSCS